MPHPRPSGVFRGAFLSSRPTTPEGAAHPPGGLSRPSRTQRWRPSHLLLIRLLQLDTTSWGRATADCRTRGSLLKQPDKQEPPNYLMICNLLAGTRERKRRFWADCSDFCSDALTILDPSGPQFTMAEASSGLSSAGEEAAGVRMDSRARRLASVRM